MYIAVCWGTVCTKLFVGVRYVQSCLLGYGMYIAVWGWGYGMYKAMFVGVQYVQSYVCWGTVCP